MWPINGSIRAEPAGRSGPTGVDAAVRFSLALCALGKSMSCKLFVANFPYSTTNEELTGLFSPHGKCCR